MGAEAAEVMHAAAWLALAIGAACAAIGGIAERRSGREA
jgi:hypothetical protein